MQLTAHIDRADEAGKKIYLDMFVDIPSHTMANSFTFSKFFFGHVVHAARKSMSLFAF